MLRLARTDHEELVAAVLHVPQQRRHRAGHPVEQGGVLDEQHASGGPIHLGRDLVRRVVAGELARVADGDLARVEEVQRGVDAADQACDGPLPGPRMAEEDQMAARVAGRQPPRHALGGEPRLGDQAPDGLLDLVQADHLVQGTQEAVHVPRGAQGRLDLLRDAAEVLGREDQTVAGRPEPIGVPRDRPIEVRLDETRVDQVAVPLEPR